MDNLSPIENEIMQIIWKLKKAFPKEILAYIMEPKPPYNTVLSTIRKLEKDGLLEYTRFGKSHQYFPKVEKGHIAKLLFQKLYHQYLGGSKLDMLSYFVEEENLTESEINELFDKIKKSKL